MRLRFLDCELDDEAFTLTRDGVVQDIEPQVFDVLHFLASNPATLVSREQLIEAVWAGRSISDSAISARISAARNAVGDDGKQQKVIRTVPRRGFQFVAEVTGAGQVTPPEEARPTIRYATASDGAKIAYAVSGNGPPLVRVPHFPTHLEMEWDESTERAMFDELGETFSLIRMDQRGCGLSDLNVTEFSAAQRTDDIMAVAKALNLDRFHLLGTSGGVMQVVDCAATHPDAIQSLVLLAGYVDGRSVREEPPESGKEDVIVEMVKAGWDSPQSAFISAYLSIYFPTASPELIQELTKIVQNSCSKENELLGRRATDNASIAGILADVRAPTLILHSSGDAVHPIAEGQKLARGIADSQLVVLESRNHYPLPEEPAWHRMMSAIREFHASAQDCA